MVIVEAGGCGVPALAYEIDGVVDSIVDDVTGWLLPVGEVCLLAGKMDSAAAQPSEVKALGRAALLRIERDFTAETIGSAWLSYYKGIM